MKKLFFSALAAIGLLLSPSCSDENEALSGSDNEALVSFNVNLADGISTKAGGYTIGKGQKVNKLHVLVYESANNAANGAVAGHISDLDKEANIAVGTPETVSFSLVKGKTYHFLFWAQYEGDGWSSPYELNDDGTVTIDYSNNGSTSPLSNDERYDAFVATETKTITTNISFDVTLTRPFAQLNFLTTAGDIQKAAAGRIIKGSGSNFDSGEESLNSIVTINNVATTLNPFTKTVSRSQSVTFAANATPFTIEHNSGVATYTANDFTVAEVGTGNTVSTSGETYYYLATNYFLVDTKGEWGGKKNVLSSAKLEIPGSDYSPLEITNIPIQWNHRTNIYGNLLTAGGTFNVAIAPSFSYDYTVATAALVGTYPEFKTQLSNPNITTITLSSNIPLTEDLVINRDVTINGQRYHYGFTGNGSVSVASDANVTFNYVTFKNTTTTALQAAAYSGMLRVENCVFTMGNTENGGQGFTKDAIGLTTNGGRISISNTTFNSNSTTEGASTLATFINIKSNSNPDKDNSATLTITDNTFGNCVGMNSSGTIQISYLSADRITVGRNTFDSSATATQYFGSDGSAVNNNTYQTPKTADQLMQYFTNGASVILNTNLN